MEQKTQGIGREPIDSELFLRYNNCGNGSASLGSERTVILIEH